MMLTKDQTFGVYGKLWMHCTCKTLIPHQYQCTCIACGCKVLNQFSYLTKNQRKETLSIDSNTRKRK